MKRIIGVALVAVLLLAWGADPAAAHSPSRLRWEGAAIVLGTIGMIAVLSDVAQAQPVAVQVGGWDPCPVYCPPPPPLPPPRPFVPDPLRRRVWVPGYWVDTQIWVPGVWGVGVWDDDSCGDRGRGGWHVRRGRHDRHGCREGRTYARETGGHFERRRAWREGHYR
jgi:hypothetical protein